MAFGQSSGPPASVRQMRALTALIEAAGHTDLRDARGPLGLTQRQASGKFTQSEADELIARLEQAEAAGEPIEVVEPVVARTAAVRSRRPAPAPRPPLNLRDVPAEVLAAELQRRGWVVMEP